MRVVSGVVFVLFAQISRVFGVVGGIDTDITEIPFQVGIIPGNANGWCGGVLISANYVLSTANCLKGTSSGTVLLGFTNMHQISDVVSIANILPFETFDPKTLQNDIAIVQLHRPARLSANVRPVQLPARRNTLTDYTGQQAQISGWGSTTGSAEDTIPAELLQAGQTQVISPFNCGRQFPYPILSSLNICTARAGAIPCFGDDGGGLTVTNDAGVHVLIGLITYTAFTDCSPTIPAVYTRIPAVVFLNWIAENSDVVIET